MKSMGFPIRFWITVIFLVSASVAQEYSVNADKDSCWDAPKWCLSVEKTRWRKNNFLVKYKNNCEHRLYVRFCNEKTNGKMSCGASGLGGGKSTSWDTYDATGEYTYKFIGVLKGSADWVCAGKVKDWHDK